MAERQISSWLFSGERPDNETKTQQEQDLQVNFNKQDEQISEYISGLEHEILRDFLEQNPHIVEEVLDSLARPENECSEFDREIQQKYAKLISERFPESLEFQDDDENVLAEAEFGPVNSKENKSVVEKEFQPTQSEEVVIYKTPSKAEEQESFKIQKENLKNSYITEIIKKYQDSSIDKENKILDVEVLEELIALAIDEIFIARDINPDFDSDLNFKNQIIEDLRNKYLELNEGKEEGSLEEIGKVEKNPKENKFELLFNQILEVYLENNKS